MVIFTTSLSPADQRSQSLLKLVISRSSIAHARQNGFPASRQASTRLIPISFSM
jgi:hypothetical protein